MNLYSVSNIVKEVLQQDERARNSDSFLYIRVIGIIAAQKGFYIYNMPIITFLLNMEDLGMPTFESVGRTRRKIQHDFPELRAAEKVQEFRAENEQTYLQYARGE